MKSPKEPRASSARAMTLRSEHSSRGRKTTPRKCRPSTSQTTPPPARPSPTSPRRKNRTAKRTELRRINIRLKIFANNLRSLRILAIFCLAMNPLILSGIRFMTNVSFFFQAIRFWNLKNFNFQRVLFLLFFYSFVEYVLTLIIFD